MCPLIIESKKKHVDSAREKTPLVKKYPSKFIEKRFTQLQFR
jgi:hypothetical protein